MDTDYKVNKQHLIKLPDQLISHQSQMNFQSKEDKHLNINDELLKI